MEDLSNPVAMLRAMLGALDDEDVNVLSIEVKRQAEPLETSGVIRYLVNSAICELKFTAGWVKGD